MPIRTVLLVVALVAAGCASSAASETTSPPVTPAPETAAVTETDDVSGELADSGDATTDDETEPEEQGSENEASAAGSSLTVNSDIPEGIPEILHAAYAPDAPRAFNGRVIPVSANSATEAAELFTAVERALRVDGLSAEAYADLGHTEQLVIRTLIRNEDWIPEFIAAVPEDLRPFAELHIEARQQLAAHVGDAPPGENVPPWQIIDPAPADELVAFYQSAGEQTGIDWEVLAGVNLVETVIGRIDGISSAGAQGPMQFLPTTWPEVSQGGDVHDPSDAIHGAARYLVQRGGLDDINAGLWGYNNSPEYGFAVLAYAEMLMLDERAFRGIYNWEVYVGSVEGLLWLPVGFSTPERFPAADYVAENPWVRTLEQ